jgi:GTPase
MALPVIALVGRPNVGKSTLFNYLTRTRDALVADMPGLTRDRKYGLGKVGARPYWVVDTGGLSGEQADGIEALMVKQVMQAVDEADVIVFLVDARDGVTPLDEQIAQTLRRYGKPLVLALNKVDGLNENTVGLDFYGLGLGEPYHIAASHGRGIHHLIDVFLAGAPAPEEGAAAESAEDDEGVKVAIVGRPNVGKSTLVNRLLGEERVLAFDQPGTTRDSVFIPFETEGKNYVLIDTAGVRRRARVEDAIEKFSVIKTLQAIEAAHVVVLVLDAQQGVSEQDAHLLGHVLDAGRGLVIALNKWDGLDVRTKQQVRDEFDRKLSFVDFARIHFISALHGSGVGKLFESVDEAYRAATVDLSTPVLTRVMEQAIFEYQPPMVRGRRIKLRYAHQGGRNPPVIVIHGNQTAEVPGAYQRYLVTAFRKHLRLMGTPIRIEFKTGENPYAGKRNTLTPRQMAKRKRLKEHIKRSK